MKRSVILMGGKTYVVSLPAKWIQKYGIQKGEELELEEIDNTVIVRTDKLARGDDLDVNFTSLSLNYHTQPTEPDSFDFLKESCRIQDLTLDDNYNSCDLIKLIKNSQWNPTIELFVKRMSQDSTLPITFLEAINNGHEMFKGVVPDPKKRSSLCEEISIEYSFDEDFKLKNITASSSLYPVGLYGGLFPSLFDESNPPAREPRGWSISSEEDALNAVKGTNDYDNIVTNQFASSIPTQDELKGIHLEKMLKL